MAVRVNGQASDARRYDVVRSFHEVEVDGRQVQLRMFAPAVSSQDNHVDATRPAVVMICGLLWLGGGFLGRIGLSFNDHFGYAFARCGVPCVQIHTPSRHMAHTRLMELACILAWPLTLVPYVAYVILVADVLLLATAPYQLVLLVLAPVMPSLLGGPLSLVMVHGAVRLVQFIMGDLPWPSHPCIEHEVAAAVTWAQEHQSTLGSDGRLVLCGYSSGGHCAAVHALSPKSQQFEAVVLISGIYGLPSTRTFTTGVRKVLRPVLDMVVGDLLGCSGAAQQDALSPESLLADRAVQDLKTKSWYVLTARMELMGLQPFEDLLFDTKPLCSGLASLGAKVNRVKCGLNHWLLLFSIDDFVRPFCASL